MICTLTFKVDRAKTTEQQEGFVPVLVSVDLMQITFWSRMLITFQWGLISLQ